MGDPEAVDKKFARELSSGTTSLALLAILSRAEEPMYGYQIAGLLVTEDGFELVKQGAIYAVLRSLERNGLLSSRIEPSVSGPPRRYYRITGEGREALKRWTNTWRRTCGLLEETLEGGRNEQSD